ncbi:adhesion G protein-coupled receptor E5 isoform X2 [Rhinoderma darwinii]|uniref:adhesion G protein-coupled receptor E5 isoform X2 n=1 Tax=Rhinoderma darwinii TaxID=43563 RepID=UPI003F669C28
MPRYWNTGIFMMTLLINGLTSPPNNTLPRTGPFTARPNTLPITGGSTSIRNPDLICPNRTLAPGETNCSKRICVNNETYDDSLPCMPGYKEHDNEKRCIDIPECRDSLHLCEAYTTCKNTLGGYYCTCQKGFQKDNKTEFCPTTNKTENKCSDIDECSIFPGICGSNSQCRNTPGSFKCTCDNGFTKVSNTCLVNCKYKTSNKKCDNDPFLCKLEMFTDQFTPFCENITGQPRLSMTELLDALDDLIDGFSYVNKTDRLHKAGLLLKNVELRIQNLALLELQNMSHINKKKTNSIEVSIGTAESGTLSVQGKNSSIKLDSKTAAGNTGVALLGFLEYTNISHILEEADLLEENSKEKAFKLVSPVVSVFLGITNTSSLKQPVSIRLHFTEKVASSNLSCVSWSVSDNSWSSKGCATLKRDDIGMTCNCTHLTSFAILMLLHDYKSWTLDLISQIGLSISIFCLVLAIITFSFCRSLHGTRNTIHTHLCISLFFGNCIFLLGITAIHNQVICGIVAGLLHAFYLCSFCWMFLEGVELYLMLVTVFNTHLKKRYLLAVGYGTPAVIITISAAIYHQGYGTNEYCWLSRKKGFIWAFMGPVCAIILVNCGIFVLTVWKLAEKMSSVSPEQGKLKRLRTLTVTSLAQLCILGSCWAFGFFMFSSATPFFAYAFTILNALQGLQIFCLHCLMHKKVRSDYKKWLWALAHFKSPVYSEFSNTSNTHTHTKGKPGKESGL